MSEPAPRLRQSFYERHESLILGGGSIVLILGLWEAAWRARLISPLFFSGPSAIATQMAYSWTKGHLKSDLVYSGTNFILGFAGAVVAGVALGILIGWYRKLRLLLDPTLTALYATPRVAMIPLILIWFGIGMWSKVFIVFISAFFPILINTVGGMRAIDRDLLRAARAFCASDWQIFKTVAIPGSVPFILTGIRQGVALGLIGVLWQNVTRRAREFGLRRAAGASQRDIQRQVLMEITLTAALGLVVGLLLVAQIPLLAIFGFIAKGALAAGAATAVAVVVGIALAAGAYPSWLATRVQPADALRDE